MSSTQTTPEGLRHGAPPAPGQVPLPPSERHHWLLAAAVALLGAGLLAAVLTGVIGGTGAQLAPPAVLVSTPTPVPAPGSAAGTGAGSTARAGTIVGSGTAQQSGGLSSYYEPLRDHISRHWMEGFYPIYTAAQHTFAVNWLLIASIHRQESAFSTAPGTYYGLNFAHCCGGPMQFNVRNGPVTTWSLVSDSYLYGARPASYDHRTAIHPSIYDDFDAIMAAAHLLSADGAGMALDQSAWDAAYDYYGHDEAGVTYADQVLARAIGWSQHGFCINCGLEPGMVSAVNGAYGAPVLAALTRPPSRSTRRRHGH
jgi:hypothetical protein